MYCRAWPNAAPGSELQSIVKKRTARDLHHD